MYTTIQKFGVSEIVKWFKSILCSSMFYLFDQKYRKRNNPAGTRRLCNVRLMLDMTSYRHCILVENENQVDVNIWHLFDVDLTLDFGYTT